jgi:hypothetical protein
MWHWCYLRRSVHASELKQRRDDMGLSRLYTGSDGQSHIEAQSAAAHLALTSQQTAAHIVFRGMPVWTCLDWHPAPRRHYVIMRSGTLEIGLCNGTVRRFGAGDAWLVEGTIGKGHTTRAVGNAPVLTTVVPLAE